MLEFPGNIVCVLQDGYKNTTRAKLYLGKRSNLESTVVDVVLFFRDYEAVQAMYLFYSQITNNTTEPFLIELPIYGTLDKWLVRLVSDMSWSNIAGNTGQMTAKLELVDKVEVIPNKDFEMYITILDEDEQDDNTNATYTVRARAGDGGGYLYILENSFTKYELEPNTNKDIKVTNNSRVYGANIEHARVMNNNRVKKVELIANENQTDASFMFYNNTELQELIIDENCFAEALTFQSFCGLDVNLLTCSDIPNSHKVETVKSMFSGCTNIELPYVETMNATEFYRFVNGCRATTQLPHYNTGSGVSFYQAFHILWSITQLPAFDFSNAKTCKEIFGSYQNLQGDITPQYFPKATDLSYAFYAGVTPYPHNMTLDITVDSECSVAYLINCDKLTNLRLQMNAPATSTYKMVENCTGLSCITGRIDTTEANSKDDMFHNCDNLAHPDTTEQDALTSDDGAIYENDDC